MVHHRVVSVDLFPSTNEQIGRSSSSLDRSRFLLFFLFVPLAIFDRRMSPRGVDDRHAEHQDRSRFFARSRRTDWTTRQLVMTILAREEDECIMASDADVEAKLKLLSTINPTVVR